MHLAESAEKQSSRQAIIARTEKLIIAELYSENIIES